MSAMSHSSVSSTDPAGIPAIARSRPSGVTAAPPTYAPGTSTVAAAAVFSGSETSHSSTSLSGARAERTVWSRVASVFPSGLNATHRLPPFRDGTAAGRAGSATFHSSVWPAKEPAAARRGAVGLKARPETVGPLTVIVAIRRGFAPVVMLHMWRPAPGAGAPPTPRDGPAGGGAR